MKKVIEEARLVEKEEIPYLRFPSEEVLDTEEERQEREKKLQRAVILGNAHKKKVRIIFADSEGVKQVHTTVWALSPKYVIFKGGIVIPLCRIVDVQEF